MRSKTRMRWDGDFYFDEFKKLCRQIMGREPKIEHDRLFGLITIRFDNEPALRYTSDEFLKMYQRFKNIIEHYKPVTYSTAPGPVGQDRSRPV